MRSSPKLRELAICVVALPNHADFEYHHHAPEFLREGGTARQLDGLRNLTNAAVDPTLFEAAERAVLALAIEMTQNVEVSAADHDLCPRRASRRSAVVEIVAVIATYNMVSRFLVALGVEPE